MSQLSYMMMLTTCLGRTGSYYLTDGERTLYIYDKDGTQTGSWTLPVGASWYSPLSEAMLVGYYYEYSEEESYYRCYLYDMKARSVKEVHIGDDTSVADALVYVSDDGLYAYYIEDVRQEGTYDVTGRRLMRIRTDSESTTPEEVFSVELPLGYDYGATDSMSARQTLPERMHFCDDTVYYLSYVDGEGFVWMRKELSSNSWAVSITDSDLPFASYGTLTASTDVRSDAEHGDYVYFTGYYESFKLKDGTVPAAARVNEGLESFYAGQRAHGDEIADTAVDDLFGEDGYWDEEYSIPAYSYDVNFGSVSRLADRYIQVAYNTYDYYGGAHGMPYLYFLLFDGETGDRKTIEDLFPGTEKEFKDIVAEYSIRAWKAGDDRYFNGYDPAMENRQRGSFLTSASFDMITEFTETGITICYTPYDQGAYASGFIDVDIPYEALGFDLKGGSWEPMKLDSADYFNIECPDWSTRFVADGISDTLTVSPLQLSQVSEEVSDWLDQEAWSARTGIALPDSMYGGTYGQGELRDGSHIYRLERDEASWYLALSVYDEATGKQQGTYDLSMFLYTPTYGNEFTTMEIPYAAIYDGTLYVELAHRTYSADQPCTGYIVAIDAATGMLKWRSDMLVANGHNFLVGEDTIICGYGFTAEDDYLYILSRYSGAVLERRLLRSAPDYFIPMDDSLYVLTYNTAYEYLVTETQ